MLRRFVTDGSMPMIDFDASRQQFVAGQIGMFFDTPARLRQVTDLVGTAFTLGTAQFPDRRQGEGRHPHRRLRDHHHHQGRGEAEGRVGVREVHHRAGSAEDRRRDHRLPAAPTSARSGPEFLGPFYDKNPNFRTVTLADRSRGAVGRLSRAEHRADLAHAARHPQRDDARRDRAGRRRSTKMASETTAADEEMTWPGVAGRAAAATRGPAVRPRRHAGADRAPAPRGVQRDPRAVRPRRSTTPRSCGTCRASRTTAITAFLFPGTRASPSAQRLADDKEAAFRVARDVERRRRDAGRGRDARVGTRPRRRHRPRDQCAARERRSDDRRARPRRRVRHRRQRGRRSPRSKPHPDPYLAALRLLGLDRRRGRSSSRIRSRGLPPHAPPASTSSRSPPTPPPDRSRAVAPR